LAFPTWERNRTPPELVVCRAKNFLEVIAKPRSEDFTDVESFDVVAMVFNMSRLRNERNKRNKRNGYSCDEGVFRAE
jgi:tRNA (Thr-GGU) A37 N-methylase